MWERNKKKFEDFYEAGDEIVQLPNEDFCDLWFGYKKIDFAISTKKPKQ